VNHRIFERTLRPLAFRGAHPFECREIIKNPFSLKRIFGLGGSMLAFAFEGELLSNKLVGSALLILNVIRCFYILDLALSLGCLLLTVFLDNDGCSGHPPSTLAGGWTHK
jgi:uncharacterized membrane protein (DUF4010 family)